jgi:rRNA maturation endonuclease Nob1
MATSKKPHHPQPAFQAKARCVDCGRTWTAAPGVDLPECPFCGSFGVTAGAPRPNGAVLFAGAHR